MVILTSKVTSILIKLFFLITANLTFIFVFSMLYHFSVTFFPAYYKFVVFGWSGLSISSNDCADKKCHSVNHGQNSVLDGSSMPMDEPNDVSENEEEINVGDADELFLHPTKSNKEESQDSKKELEECKPLDTSTSLSTLAALPNKDHVMCSNDLDMDNVGIPEENIVDPTSTDSDPVDIHEHLDGMFIVNLYSFP
jgi:hypothetical protein